MKETISHFKQFCSMLAVLTKVDANYPYLVFNLLDSLSEWIGCKIKQ